MSTLSPEQVNFAVEETRWGVWRRFTYPSGEVFATYTSHAHLLGLPLLHRTWGRCPCTGQPCLARGVIAIGRFAQGGLAIGQVATGLVAVGQAATGLVAVGQLALGLVLGVGQLATGVVAVGQVAIGVAFGLGQFANGYVAIGQTGWGDYVLAQEGWGNHVWDQAGAAPEAQDFFRSLLP